MKQFNKWSYIAMALFVFSACQGDHEKINVTPDTDIELDEEWYAGGKSGTVYNATSFAYVPPTPFVLMSGLAHYFNLV